MQVMSFDTFGVNKEVANEYKEGHKDDECIPSYKWHSKVIVGQQLHDTSSWQIWNKRCLLSNLNTNTGYLLNMHDNSIIVIIVHY